jgi:2-oxoglutarate ferredoxin oxidoreductase subunit alpha
MATAFPIAPIPGTHPTKGAYFTRGTTRDAYRALLRGRADYVATWSGCCASGRPRSPRAAPLRYSPPKPTRFGVIYFGSTSPAMDEALARSKAERHHVDALRVRAFPLRRRASRTSSTSTSVFVVEQNRDAQLRSLLVNESASIPQARARAAL